jgi:hypothetical protein
MSVLVEQQDETITAIETTAGNVQKDTEAGYIPFSLALLAVLIAISQSRLYREGRGISPCCSQEAVDMLHSHIGHPGNRGHHRGSCRHQQPSHKQKLKKFALFGPSDFSLLPTDTGK